MAVYRVLVVVGLVANTSETRERNTIAESAKEAAASDDRARAVIEVVGSRRLGVLVGASSREKKSHKLHQSK